LKKAREHTVSSDQRKRTRRSMKRLKALQLPAAVLGLAMLLTSCMAGTRLNAFSAEPATVSGTFTLLLHGCKYGGQIDNVAILVDEQGKYPVDIYDLPASYKVKKGVPAKEAIAEATSFVACSTHMVWKTRTARIADAGGGTIGYEVRPLYFPLEFGNSDPLKISYFLRTEGVRVYIRIDSTVEKELEGSGEGRSSEHVR
jgi:hypothetical protein